jgi:simple sugar transport system ATP-binding protein
VQTKDEFALRMRGISKSYFGNRVLKDINIEVRPGEIHGIVGENGAGKSTLMNILFGMSVIHSTGGYEGTLEIGGVSAVIKSPIDAMNLGIGMVHQEFMLIPGFTITENIKLNREITKKNIVSRVLGQSLDSLDMRAMREDARRALDKLEMNIDEWASTAGLPVGHMQFIEIAREIDKKNMRLLVFDEPTAVLAESEAANLLEAVKKLAREGIAILFISHRLHEIMDACDTISVLRDGALVATMPKNEATLAELARLMVGRKIEAVERASRVGAVPRILLEIRGLRVDMPGERVRNVDLDVIEGEILGIGGLAGQGKIGIANGIMGLYPSSGEVRWDGQKLLLNNPREAIAKGLAFLSENRRGVGLLLELDIETNIVATAVEMQGAFLKMFGPVSQMDGKKITAHAREMISRLDIRCTGPGQPVKRLSGGNQQKVCIARVLTLGPRLLFVSEPTRGIDIGAKKLVLDTLVGLNKDLNMTIVITSSELAELRSVCDRIAIINEGKIAGVLPPTADDVDFGLMMAGEYDKRN